MNRSGTRAGLKLNLALALLVAAAFAASIAMGRGGAFLTDAFREAYALDPETFAVILYDIRLPRALLGLFIGASLGLCGAALQGLLQNPLAEPGLIGASSGAALGAVSVFYFSLGGGMLGLPLGGIAGAALALGILYALAGRNPSLTTLILAGVAISAFAGALTSLALSLAPRPYAALEIVFWMLGSLADRSMEHVLFAAPFMGLGALIIASTARALDAYALGEDTATSLGFNPASVKARVILGTALAVGAAVAVTGVVGFIGLVVPHLVRPLVGHSPARLLLPSALAGAALTLAADIVVRLPPTGLELKLGVITALLGAPFFLYLVLKARREAAW